MHLTDWVPTISNMLSKTKYARIVNLTGSSVWRIIYLMDSSEWSEQWSDIQLARVCCGRFKGMNIENFKRFFLLPTP